ncbi:hypothetical protein RHMOL_Rhmol10G0145300 [Rhododendron molle]|uniref:Uncharacterized protein n=1 Tax=Rhododendron molle TaxID=49168 RepID=A0ACC0M2F2_RHOML|nr:hypothetical protein RHMOL_Rhmol10G0145300 [Rhododendron molle]
MSTESCCVRCSPVSAAEHEGAICAECFLTLVAGTSTSAGCFEKFYLLDLKINKARFYLLLAAFWLLQRVLGVTCYFVDGENMILIMWVLLLVAQVYGAVVTRIIVIHARNGVVGVLDLQLFNPVLVPGLLPAYSDFLCLWM